MIKILQRQKIRTKKFWKKIEKRKRKIFENFENKKILKDPKNDILERNRNLKIKKFRKKFQKIKTKKFRKNSQK